MLTPHLDDGDVQLYLADCVDAMRALPANSVDAIVTDPPYALPGGFMGKAWDRFDGTYDAGFAYYLAGLIDGEGSFRVQRHERGTHTCAFGMKLRADDEAILRKARTFIDAGTITKRQETPTAPQIGWVVQDKDGCERLVGFLRRFPLRAKKRRDFEAWADAVEEWTNRPRGNRWNGAADQTRAATMKVRVESARVYRDVAWSGNEFQDWVREWAEEAFRVAKPGAHLAAFGGTRTYHRLASGIEDAGWEVRDCLAWLYGSGFPKSLDVSKAIDKAAGAAPVPYPHPTNACPGGEWCDCTTDNGRYSATKHAPGYRYATPLAAEWDGWGTALKPAHEPIILARKPLTGTVAANVLQHGTGALNVDACRIGSGSTRRRNTAEMGYHGGNVSDDYVTGSDAGRWPANVVLDAEAAAHLDAQSGERPSGARKAGEYGGIGTGAIYGDGGLADLPALEANTGGASRFYYTAKADAEERTAPDGTRNTHPTVKPTDLMRWLVRLITPPGGLVLDPFAGSGSTGVATRAEGFRCVLIERDPDYARIIASRLAQQTLFGGTR